jgi:hypothetical protein
VTASRPSIKVTRFHSTDGAVYRALVIGVSRSGATATVATLADAKERAALGELRVPTNAATNFDVVG